MRVRFVCSALIAAGAVTSLGGVGFLASPAVSAVKPVKAKIIKIDAGAVRYEPRVITVTVGQPVIFRITNSSSVDHEALLGDEKVQAAHAKEMKSMASKPGPSYGMKRGSPVFGKPGEGYAEMAPAKSADIKTTFSKVGRTILGCHLPGHYEGGMRLTVIVKAPTLGGLGA